MPALAGLALLLGGCAMRQMIYPTPAIRVGEPPRGYEEVLLDVSGGGRVHGWHRERPAASLGAPAMLFFHGNGENLETLRLGGLLQELAGLDGHLLVIDYPGYGRSPGRPSETSIAAAAAAALTWLEQRYPGAPKVVVGWSLGAAVAARLGADRGDDIAAAILLSPWTSLAEVARQHYPAFLVDLVLRESYDSLAAAPRLRCPVLVVHGAGDRIIPAIQGRRLAEAVGGPVEWVEVTGAGHNDLLSHGVVWDRMRAFLARIEV